MRAVFFQDPDDGSWHRLEWEHSAALGAAFSDESIKYARRLAARQDRWGDETAALTELLTRWDMGMISNRRERRMAARLAAERAALPIPDDRSQVAALPSLAALAAGAASVGGIADDAARAAPSAERVASQASRSDDVVDDLDGLSSDEDFYADAFEVLE